MFEATGANEEAERILALAEALFDEFHSPSTSNQRKSAIEVQLKSLLGDIRHWKTWTDCLLLSRNQYLVWFCLNCLNDFISDFWTTWASEEQKTYIKQRLLWYMSTKNIVASFPSFILTKLLKVFVDIGRNDWPEKYPDFLSHIETFVKDAELRSTGLRMLRLVSEEFISSKTDMSQSRKNILKTNLSQRIPVWMELVYTFIQPVVQVVAGDPQQIPVNDSFTSALRDTSDALHLLTHVFSWLPGNILVSRPLLDSLFKLANCDTSDSSLSDLATSSLSTVAELAGRACMSADMEKTLWVIYEFAYVRLDSVTAQLNNQEEMSDESDASLEYYQQFVELIRSLVISHLQRFEQHKDFPTMNFLEKFFRFTFSISVLDLFLSCVDIWNDFLDRILALASARTSSVRQVIIQSYTAPILALVDHLLLRVQFQHNSDQLDELSSDMASQTAGLTEREDYFQRCVNVVIKAGEILPTEVLAKLSQTFSQLHQGFLQVKRLVQKDGNESLMLNLTDKQKKKEAHWLLQDLGIITRTLATHCGFLTGDLFLSFHQQVSTFLQHLLENLELSTAILLFTDRESSNVGAPSSQTENDFRHVVTCGYQSVEGLFPWIVQLYHQETTDTNQHSAILTTLIGTTLRPVMSQPDHAVMLASTKVLCTISKTIRSSEVLNIRGVAGLYEQLTSPTPRSAVAFSNLQLAVQINLASALSNVLTLPHSSRGHVTTAEENKNWEERATKHGQLMAALTRRVDGLPEKLNDQDMEVLKGTLALVDGLLLNISEDPKKSKQIMLASLTPFLTTLARRPERSQILHTVYNVFSSLKNAFPPELASPLSDLFEKLFEQFLDPEELLKALRSSDPSEVESLSTCFDLLKLVVSDPAYKSYLPMVIMLCHIVCPALNTLTDIRVDFRTASYELLLSVLMHHWTYFFKSVRMVAATNGDGIETTTEEQSESKDFLVILQCLGGALLQPEISATQVVLEGLNQLHRTRQVFDKAPFQQVLRVDFLNALLRLLVHKDKQLLSDDMYLAVYNIASSDFTYFRGQYLPSLLGQWLAGSDVTWQRRVLDGFVHKEDHNGFVEQLQNVIIEVRCYLLYQANLVSASSVPL